MKADDLRASILQAATQGKLTKQDPNDEPASVLIERIRDEKHRLIKEGKIKKDKNESFIFKRDGNWFETINGNDERCIDDEIPFEIPDSWSWTRLAGISQFISDGVHKTPQYVDNGIPFLSVQNISKGFLDLSSVKYISEDEYQQITHNIKPSLNDILICRIGTLGKAITVNFNFEFAIFVSLALIRLVDCSLNDFIVLCINSDYGSKWINSVKVGGGTHTNKINLSSFYSFLIPLPPKKEQTKIIAKVLDLERLLKYYQNIDYTLTRIVEDLPSRLTSSTLQAAVQGKLTYQDSNDGPASVLIERIRDEKHRLIMEGKIKKDKNESFIFKRDGNWFETINGNDERCIDDEIPFEIPVNWAWVRLKTICIKITDGTHHSPPNGPNGDFLYISAKNIKDHGVDTSNATYVSKKIHQEIYSRCDPQYGDVLLIKDGATAGVVTVNNLDYEFSLLSSVGLLRIHPEINNWYIVWVLRSSRFQQITQSKMKGTGIPRITLNIINDFLVPIPPMEEQNRIVEEIDRLHVQVNLLRHLHD